MAWGLFFVQTNLGAEPSEERYSRRVIPVSVRFWREVTGHPLGSVTARQLLTHTAGVPLRAQLKNLYGTSADEIRRRVLHEQLHRPPGEAAEYTDRAALILGHLAEYLSGQLLDQPATTRTWLPTGMDSTRFGPLSAEIASRCAPTELDQDTDTHLKGIAHDFSARLLGGVCGIAGVFTVLDDLAAFPRYMLAPAVSPSSAGFGTKWTARSLSILTGELEPIRGPFWHPAPGYQRRTGRLDPLRLHRYRHADLAFARTVGGAADQQALPHPRSRTSGRHHASGDH